MVENFTHHSSEEVVKTNRGRCLTFVTNCLRFISLGQYNTVLFHNQASLQSSIYGGIITLALVISFFAYSVTIFIPIFKREMYNF